MSRKEAAGKLCLGSWHIYSRMTLEENARFIEGALERGVREFDIGDYWDHDLLNTVRFKEVVRMLGLPRSAYRFGLKVFTSSVETRDAAVRRMLDLLEEDYADYVLCSRPNMQETMQQAVEGMNELVTLGLTKELDFSLWDAPLLKEAYDLMKEQNMALPKFVQFQYNLCRRDVVESPAYQDLFESTGLKFQAAFTLEGGILAGHVHRRRFEPEERAAGIWFPEHERNLARDSGGIRDKIAACVPRLSEVAASVGMTSAQLAVAFAATHPHLENVLIGASSLKQVDEALDAIAFAMENPGKVRQLTEEFYIGGAAAPKLFDFSAGILR